MNLFLGELPRREEGDKRQLTPFQEFAEKCRDRLRVVVREFSYEAGLSEGKRKKRETLEMKLRMQTKAVAEVCVTYFSEIFELYIHVKMLRVIIESMMRFGTDPTVIFFIEPANGKEKTVQSLLCATFGDKDSEGLYGTKDEIEDGEDFFPFVYVPGILF